MEGPSLGADVPLAEDIAPLSVADGGGCETTEAGGGGTGTGLAAASTPGDGDKLDEDTEEGGRAGNDADDGCTCDCTDGATATEPGVDAAADVGCDRCLPTRRVAAGALTTPFSLSSLPAGTPPPRSLTATPLRLPPASVALKTRCPIRVSCGAAPVPPPFRLTGGFGMALVPLAAPFFFRGRATTDQDSSSWAG